MVKRLNHLDLDKPNLELWYNIYCTLDIVLYMYVYNCFVYHIKCYKLYYIDIIYLFTYLLYDAWEPSYLTLHHLGAPALVQRLH
jgi:hypothetical protein